MSDERTAETDENRRKRVHSPSTGGPMARAVEPAEAVNAPRPNLAMIQAAPPGDAGRARALLSMQRVAGNAAVGRLLGGPAVPGLQAKLQSGSPGDSFEEEADRVARGLGPAPAVAGAEQRATAAGGSVPRSPLGLSGGQPLPERERAAMEAHLGHDFSMVRVHTGPNAGELADSLSARAVTAGRDILFGAGEFAPHTTPGQQLLAHELTHTIQQGVAAPLTPFGDSMIQPAALSATGGPMAQGGFFDAAAKGASMYWRLDDEGSWHARELMEHRMLGLGLPYVANSRINRWNEFMAGRPEIQRAMAKQLREQALLLASKTGGGTVQWSFTGVALNELESMRLTLHGCHRIDVKATYEVVSDAAGNTQVRFLEIEMIWIDVADLHPGTTTELADKTEVDDAEFSAAGWDYDIEIHFWAPGVSTWQIGPTGAEPKEGWPPITGVPQGGFRG